MVQQRSVDVGANNCRWCAGRRLHSPHVVLQHTHHLSIHLIPVCCLSLCFALATHSTRRGPVSYDEGDGGRQGGYENRRGGGGRGGYGRGRGGRGGGGGYDQKPKRVLSPEAAAVNEALAAATSWRQLNAVLEQQVCCWR